MPDQAESTTSVRALFGTRITIALVAFAMLCVAAATIYFAAKEVATNDRRNTESLALETREAANAVRQFLASRQRLVEAFATEKSPVLNALARDINNDALREQIAESLERWFPNYFTFTLADQAGHDLIDDIEGFVGQACQANILTYVDRLKESSASHAAYEAVIHPQAHNYHFDIMAPWREDGALRGVFFVSFYPVTIQDLLRAHQMPNHHLALVHRHRDHLIEVNGDGARDEISATRPVNLTPAEISEIRARQRIPGSVWELVGYLEPGLTTAESRAVWARAVAIVLFVLLAGGIGCWEIWKLGTARRLAFDQLQVSNRDLAEMADEQKSLRRAAEAAEQAKAQFLASMSHEIRTPLNAVIGLTDLVLKTDLTDLQRGHLSRVHIAGRNLLELINDILDFSKIEAGKMEIEAIEFDLDEVLEHVATVVSTKADENGNEVIVSVDRAIPASLKGDSLRLGQVLINLAGNAAKFTENGEIIIEAARVAGADGDWLEFQVRDTGIGMTPEQTQGLFKPFVQADQTVTRDYGGTGLGLSISSQLVAAMGGSIGVNSTPGVGSTFHFRIPLVLGESAVARDNFTGIDPRTTRILVVDDSAVLRETLARTLGALKFKVDVAATGAEALTKLSADADGSPFDVIIVDWKMPGMDGLETVRRLRQDTAPSATPVIMMISAHDMADIRDDLSDLDVAHTVQKPVNTSFMVDTLMEVFHDDHERRSISVTHRTIATDGAAVAGTRLLLAEDNELNQMVAVGVLEHAGFAVDVAENGALAVDRLRDGGADSYAVVLMDIQMPEMDGLTATRKIRDELRLDALPVIAMTAHALDEERDRCIAAGMNDHVSKPIDARELIAKINKWAAAAGSPAAAAINMTPGGDAVFDPIAAAGQLKIPPDLMDTLLGKFVTEFGDADAALKARLAALDIDGAILLVHSMRGSAGSLGMAGVGDAAAALETRLTDNGTAEADLIASFGAALDEALAAIDRHLNP